MDVSQLPDLSQLSSMSAVEIRRAMDIIGNTLQATLIGPDGETRDLDASGARDSYNQLLALHDKCRAHLAIREAADRGSGVRAFGAEVMTRVGAWDGTPVDRLPAQQARSIALKALETQLGTEHLSDRQRDQVDAVLRADDPYCDGSQVARRTILTENEHYRSAWARVIGSGSTAMLDQAEIAAVRAFQEFERRESRAMSEGTTTAGGFGVPVFIDPTIVLTGQESNNPFLTLARQVPVTTNVWKGVNSAGVSWSFDSEGTAVSDDSPTLGQPTATIFTARGFIPYSIEVGQDYPGFADEMARLLAAGYTDLEINKLTNGNGTTEPNGIITQLSANTNCRIAVTTAGTLGVADVYKGWEAVPVRFRGDSSTAWLSSTGVQDKIRQFGATYGANYTVDLTQPVLQYLLGARYAVTDYAPSVTSLSIATTNAPWAIVGAWSHMVVARRQGMNVESVPLVFDTTSGRPTGQRGVFAWARVGATTDTPLAFRMITNVA